MIKKLEITPLSEWGMFSDPQPSVVAGPCSAETEEQVMKTAEALKELGINVFRAEYGSLEPILDALKESAFQD